MMAFKLPMNVLAVQQILKNQNKQGLLRKGFTELEQAQRVGWRILKNWVEAQLAIIETKMVTVDQIYLPYATGKDGKTIYDRFVENRSKFMLEDKE